MEKFSSTDFLKKRPSTEYLTEPRFKKVICCRRNSAVFAGAM